MASAISLVLACALGICQNMVDDQDEGTVSPADPVTSRSEPPIPGPATSSNSVQRCHDAHHLHVTRGAMGDADVTIIELQSTPAAEVDTRVRVDAGESCAVAYWHDIAIVDG